MASGADLPVRGFASKQSFERWLERNCESADGLWLKLAKKGSGVKSVTYGEAVRAGLAYGWIDSQVRSHDERHYLQRFTPRRAKSKWSKLNCEAAEELIASGEMRPAGLREVERAKADGRWDAAYEPASRATVPADLGRQLDRNPGAREAFAALDAASRYGILYRIQDAKRPETRARRIAEFVAKLAADARPPG